MCKSKAEGGSRCELADSLANVRRKARYKVEKAGGSAYEKDRAVKDALKKFYAENRTLVHEHAPERKSFQRSPGKHAVHKEIMSLMKRTTPIKRTGDIDDLTQEEYLRAQEVRSKLDEDEVWMLHRYQGFLFEKVNTYLRRCGFSDKNEEDVFEGQTRSQRAKKDAEIIQKIIMENQDKQQVHKMYRYYRVPQGMSPDFFAERYFKEGESYQDAGFMSASMDPDFIMHFIMHTQKYQRNDRYVVFEILTRQGISLQGKEDRSPGNIQSLEHERLLPKNMKMRILKTRKRDRIHMAQERSDLRIAGRSNDTYSKGWKYYNEGASLTVPVIQMVDEKLIEEYARKK